MPSTMGLPPCWSPDPSCGSWWKVLATGLRFGNARALCFVVSSPAPAPVVPLEPWGDFAGPALLCPLLPLRRGLARAGAESQSWFQALGAQLLVVLELKTTELRADSPVQEGPAWSSSGRWLPCVPSSDRDSTALKEVSKVSLLVRHQS